MEAIIIFAVLTFANLAGGTLAADAYYDYRQVPEGRVEIFDAKAAARSAESDVIAEHDALSGVHESAI